LPPIILARGEISSFLGTVLTEIIPAQSVFDKERPDGIIGGL
jgi:hypothetical protein